MRTLQGGAEFPERHGIDFALTSDIAATEVFVTLSPERRRLLLTDAWPNLARIALNEVNLN
ncbi:hypothetical protein CYG49_02285 [Candidatus Saccharibacteria bacterium]|nr:MAG: hypothetical protein CYG49_02285 [Candidatus Saccharibacteria bacterium]